MTPDDPRHGSYAGALQHWRAGEKACPACLVAANRDSKRRELERLAGRPSLQPLGERAHRIVLTAPRALMAQQTRMSPSQLARYAAGGPDTVVRRSTRQRILAYRLEWTPAGIQRRLQALTRLGWSMRAVADATGLDMQSLCTLRRNPDLRFVRRHFAAGVLEFWDDHHETPAPDSHSSRETTAEAVRRGWWPPAAWDDIDDPDEDPTVGLVDGDMVDDVVVARVLAGERLPCNRAEKAEVLRRAAAAGRSLNSLERQMGWNAIRDRKGVAA